MITRRAEFSEGSSCSSTLRAIFFLDNRNCFPQKVDGLAIFSLCIKEPAVVELKKSDHYVANPVRARAVENYRDVRPESPPIRAPRKFSRASGDWGPQQAYAQVTPMGVASVGHRVPL